MPSKKFSPRMILLAVGFLLIMLLVNGLIISREREISEGTRVVLALVPRDPRSLIQGDYMTLRYEIARKVPSWASESIYLTLDSEDQVKQLTASSQDNNIKLRFRRHDGQVKFGIESFFFQEGRGQEFDRARYAEVRVSRHGQAFLIKLLNEDLKPI